MKLVLAICLLVPCLGLAAACGGATAERAKDDVNGVGSDLRTGVSDSPDAKKTDGGPVVKTDAGDKK